MEHAATTSAQEAMRRFAARVLEENDRQLEAVDRVLSPVLARAFVRFIWPASRYGQENPCTIFTQDLAQRFTSGSVKKKDLSCANNWLGRLEEAGVIHVIQRDRATGRVKIEILTLECPVNQVPIAPDPQGEFPFMETAEATGEGDAGDKEAPTVPFPVRASAGTDDPADATGPREGAFTERADPVNPGAEPFTEKADSVNPPPLPAADGSAEKGTSAGPPAEDDEAKWAAQLELKVAALRRRNAVRAGLTEKAKTVNPLCTKDTKEESASALPTYQGLSKTQSTPKDARKRASARAPASDGVRWIGAIIREHRRALDHEGRVRFAEAKASWATEIRATVPEAAEWCVGMAADLVVYCDDVPEAELRQILGDIREMRRADRKRRDEGIAGREFRPGALFNRLCHKLANRYGVAWTKGEREQ